MELFSNPTLQGIIGTALLALLTEGLRRIIKIEGLVKRVTDIEEWKDSMDKELESKFVRKEIMELQIRNLNDASERIEKMVDETRKSLHDVRNLLIRNVRGDK